MNIVVDLADHLILSTLCSRGPRPDVDELKPLLDNICDNVVFDQFLADAGFDSEPNHELMRETFGIESIIPAKIGRPTQKLPAGKWRWLMATDFDDEAYAQRWQVETVLYMLKARQGSELTARHDVTRAHEMGLMAVTHNILIVLFDKLFYKAGGTLFQRSTV